jgi:hypothetical protein
MVSLAHAFNVAAFLPPSYERIVQRIYNNETDSRRRAAAAKLLALIVCAKRPLRWHEIQGAFAISLDDATVDFENRRLRVDAKELCGSLINLHACGTIELVHTTARKYVTLDFLEP